MDQREINFKDRWKAIPSKSDDFLKGIARDIYNGLIFTDRHCKQSEIKIRFLCLMMMGPKYPSAPGYKCKSDTIENKRENNIYDVIQRDDDQVKFEEDLVWYNIELNYYRENYLKSIGMVYEYLDKASPRSINFGPSFMSIKLLNIEDSKKVWDFYEIYKEIREKADIF